MKELPSDITGTTHPVYRWIVEHDERWSFLLLYVGLAVTLTLWLGVFWLLVIVAGHFGLELIKKHHDGCRGRRRMVAWALWDMKFDLALVAWALAILAYTATSVGVVGASSAGRIAMLGKGGYFPVRDLIILSRVAMVRKADRISKLRMLAAAECRDTARAERLRCAAYPWQQKLRWFDHVSLVLAALCLIAIALAPAFTGEHPGDLAILVLEQLHPFPE